MGETTPVDEGRSSLELQIQQIWHEILRRNNFDRNAHFYDLGGTSLTGLRLISRISKEIGVNLPPESFLDYPTVASMTEYVAIAVENRSASEGAPAAPEQ